MFVLNRRIIRLMFAFGLVSLLIVATMPAHAQMPSLEGTTYGDMLQDLDDKVMELDRASGMEEDDQLRELVLLIAHQNRTMIRMIDGLHKQVNGLVASDQGERQIQRGKAAFKAASEMYQERGGPGGPGR